MSETTYFAYGSNMLPSRLVARCPSARLIGAGRLHGFRADYSKRGRDGSGKATIFEAEGTTPGALFALAPTCAATLDAIEGPGYAKRTIRVQNDTGELWAQTYIALPEARDPALRPFHWYKGLITVGLAAHALSNPDLERPESRNDPDADRHALHTALMRD